MQILRSNSKELRDQFLESVGSDRMHQELPALSEFQIVCDRTGPPVYVVTLRFLPDLFLELSLTKEELPDLLRWCCDALVGEC